MRDFSSTKFEQWPRRITTLNSKTRQLEKNLKGQNIN